ncbi:MAG: DivIVA domain-containing protein [Nocardioides sp.]
MWLFAILVVLALGGIAVVAAGRGAPLAEAYDDRPDVTVAAGGPVTASDLRGVRFTLALRGYRMSEVDALLSRLAAQLEDAQPGTGPGGPAPGERPPNPDGRGDEPST